MGRPFPHPLKNPLLVQQEYDRIFSALCSGAPVPSHIYVVMVQAGVLTRQWSFENLTDYLRLSEEKDPEVTIRKLWQSTPEIHPSVRNTSGNVRMVLRGGTPVNLTDFIIACCQDKTLLKTFNQVIVKLVLFSFSILKAHHRGMVVRIRKKLDVIHHVLNTHTLFV